MKINSSISDFIPEIETNINKKHPKDVLSSAKKISENISINDQAINRKVDELITIDGIESKDLDDAFFVEKLKNGGYILKVAISDVSETIQPLTNIDIEALKRSTSVYFENYSIPMIPKILSEDKLSLNHKKNRLTLTIQIEIDDNYKVKNTDIYESITYNKNRFDYKSFADSFMELGSEYQSMFELSYDLAKKLYLRRMNKGAIDYDESDRKIMIGRNLKLGKNIAQLIIQEFMILANIESSKYMQKNKISGIYRNHMPNHKGKDISNYNFLERATYDPEMKFHLGLAEDNYAHFTSPIRRYPDLVNHRGIKQFIRKDEPIYLNNDIIEICNYINLKLAATIVGQKTINYNGRIVRKLRKSDNKIHDEKTEKVYFMDQVKKHTHQKIKLPEQIVKNVINQISKAEKVPSWILQTFILSSEIEIVEAIKNKSLERYDYKRTINLINNIGKTNSNKLGHIEIKETDLTEAIKNNSPDKKIKIEFKFKNKRKNVIEGRPIQSRKAILENIFDFLIEKNTKN